MVAALVGFARVRHHKSREMKTSRSQPSTPHEPLLAQNQVDASGRGASAAASAAAAAAAAAATAAAEHEPQVRCAGRRKAG